jgi:diguanylate cyclase (GGDEF)-like protein/PAS domain S-box-containing protein
MGRDYLTPPERNDDGGAKCRAEPADHREETATYRAELAMLRMVAENTVDVIIRYDSAGRRIYVSPAVRDMVGMEPDEMIGGHAIELLHPDDVAQAREIIAQMGPAHPSLDNIFRVRRRDGVYIWIEGRYRYLKEDGGHVAVLRDITASKLAEEVLAETNRRLAAANDVLQGLAERDGMTGLSNRRHFDELRGLEFARARREGLPLGLVMADVDHFKGFNDRYGHLAGDDCLRRVSAAIVGALRRPADRAARYGGEEIAVLLPGTDREGAVVIAERIRGAVQALRIAHAGSAFGIVTISAGASALMPAEGSVVADDLVAMADQALYRAKAAGRNRVCGSFSSPQPAAARIL